MGSMTRRLRKTLRGNLAHRTAFDFETWPILGNPDILFQGGDYFHDVHGRPDLVFVDEMDRLGLADIKLRPHQRSMLEEIRTMFLNPPYTITGRTPSRPLPPRPIVLSGVSLQDFPPGTEIQVSNTGGEAFVGHIDPGSEPGRVMLVVDGRRSGHNA